MKQASGRKKHEPLNEYISLSEDLNLFLLDNPESRMIAQENMEKRYQLIDKQLSSMERQVLKLYLEGGSYEEIAEEMGRSEKSVDNAIQRLKKKLKKVEKSVDTQDTLWYYNQVATRDERHKSFSNIDKYWVWKQWTLITEQKDNLENSFLEFRDEYRIR